MRDESTAVRGELAGSVALVALVAIVGAMIYLAGRPLSTPDLWWHLKMGEVYASEGLWPDGDPMLHTAHSEAPVQHEWLFGVMVHAVESVGGFAGLRVFHALAVAAILLLVYRVSRREAGSLVAACFATTLFVSLAWPRLAQLRPDLVSIPAALAVYHLLLQGRAAPTWRRIAAALTLLVVWANMHSLFAIGLALIVAALMGVALRPALISHQSRRGCREEAGEAVGQRAWAVRLGTAFALGVVLTALNPRGFAQHLTFFTSSQEAAIWYIRDEWLAFDPFRWGHYPPASVSFTAWIFTDALLAAFFAVALVIGARFWRRPTASDREALEPVRFGIGLAGVVALLVSIRFLWMGIFPMLFLLRALRLERARSPRVGVGFDRALMAGTLLLVGLFSGVTGFRHDSAAPGFYLSRPYSVPDYYAAAVHFLHETGVEGKLFNEYGLGGYLGYWLSPKLRTFIDSRTEHYAPDVLYDCLAIYEQRGRLPKESIADVLERREVDLFIGTGLPLAHRASKKAKRYTTSHLEHATGWLLVSRSANQAIYLRKNERNRDNLELISDYYERQGVPFDSAIGLHPGQVIAERPDWAIAHQMIPFEYELWLNESEDPDPEVRFRAIDRLAAALGLVGAYETAADFELEALALWPGSEAVRRRLAYDLLRLDRFEEAREQGRLLVELHRDSQRAVLFAATADRYSALRLQGRDVWPPDDDHPPIDSIVNRLPLLDDAETAYYVHGRYARVADPQ